MFDRSGLNIERTIRRLRNGIIASILAFCLISFATIAFLESREELGTLKEEIALEASTLAKEVSPLPATATALDYAQLYTRHKAEHGSVWLPGTMLVYRSGSDILAVPLSAATGKADPKPSAVVASRRIHLAAALGGSTAARIILDPMGRPALLASSPIGSTGIAISSERPLGTVLRPFLGFIAPILLITALCGTALFIWSRNALERLDSALTAGHERLQTEINVRRAAQAGMRSLFAESPEAQLVIAEDGRIVMANRKAEELFGLAASEMASRPLSSLIPGAPTSLTSLEEVAGPARVLEGNPLEGERRDGETFPVELAIRRPDVDSNIFVSVRDVTSLARSQNEQVEAHRSTLRLLDATSVGMIGIDEHGTIRFANRSAAGMLGYPNPVGLQGRSIADHLRHSDAHRPGAPGSPASRRDTDLIRAHDDDAVLRRLDGSTFPTEYWSADHDDGRSRSDRVITFLDITDRKIAEANLLLRDEMQHFVAQFASRFVSYEGEGLERAIQNALARLGQFVDCERVLLLLRDDSSDSDERYEWSARPAGHLSTGSMPDGETEDGLAGHPDAESGHRIIGDFEGTKVSAAIRSGNLTRGVLVLVDLHAEHLPREVLQDFVNIVAEILSEVVSRQRVARELAESQNRLQQSQKLESIGALAAGVAHEINTPMQYIGDNLNFLGKATDRLLAMANSVHDLSESEDAPAPIRAELERVLGRTKLGLLRDRLPKALDNAHEGVRAVSKIVQALKGFAHTGGESFDPSNLNDAITITSTVCRNEWKYVADLELDLDPDLPVVPCRVDELKQVILNLIVNAAHAIGDRPDRAEGEKGRIVVKTVINGDYAEIRVSDTGCGIPETIQRRIFDPFFTTKEVGRGSGQGLAIARSVIEKEHRGRLSFETAENEGTTFIVSLPLQREETKEAAA